MPLEPVIDFDGEFPGFFGVLGRESMIFASDQLKKAEKSSVFAPEVNNRL